MALTWPFKDPQEVLDYYVDWTDRLGLDNIDTSTWSFDPTNPDSALVMDSNSHDTKTTTLWLSGGTLGKTYILINQIITTDTPQRVMEQSVKLKIKNK